MLAVDIRFEERHGFVRLGLNELSNYRQSNFVAESSVSYLVPHKLFLLMVILQVAVKKLSGRFPDHP